MAGRRTNLALAVLPAIALVTGVVAFDRALPSHFRLMPRRAITDFHGISSTMETATPCNTGVGCEEEIANVAHGEAALVPGRRDNPHAPLSPGHGAPLRLVAPGRRGFWWVKWVDRVIVDDRPAWWQPPCPLT